MPTFSQAAVTVAALGCAGVLAGAVNGLHAQQTPALDVRFHSIVPAQPKLSVGALGDISIGRDEMDKARAAWRQGRFEAARTALEQSLEAGNVVAAWYLGHMYRLGRGVERSDKTAFSYFRQTALAYDAEEPRRRIRMIMVDSLVRVADVYRDGLPDSGIESDARRAFNLYNVAAGHGHPAAYFGLGVIYLKGLGIKKRPTRAVWWLKKAARKRFAPAQALLGDLNWSAKTGSAGRIHGLKWYLIAQRSTQPALHPHIFDRLDEMLATTSDDERGKAEALAMNFAQEFPVGSSTAAQVE